MFASYVQLLQSQALLECKQITNNKTSKNGSKIYPVCIGQQCN